MHGHVGTSVCEFSTGSGTNASEILVGPVKKLVYFHLNL